MAGAEKNSTPAKLLQHPKLNYDADKVTQIIKENDVSFEHAKIIHYADKWQNIPEYTWKSGDLLYWKTLGGDDFIHQEKLGFINNYKDVIKDAAEKYDIPPLLLAGVAYIEYGGDPIISDDIMYTTRSLIRSIIKTSKKLDEFTISKKPELTSFGNTSIQVRRAIEMLGYDKKTNKTDKILDSLRDPIQNIYLAACHLNQLRNIDFEGKTADELTEDEIKIIASRYNIGPDPTYEAMLGSTDYGTRILNNKDGINSALQ